MNVLVTGGTGGIGRRIVEDYINHGYNVLSPSSQELDLSSDRSIQEYFSINHSIDIFVHCAGINNPVPFLEIDKSDLSKTLMVNVLSGLEIAQHVLPDMIAKKFGRIVNISSLWSILAKPGRTAYSISKASVDALTRSLAVEFGEYNILVNSVLPGFVDTPLTRKNLSSEKISEIASVTPIRRLVDSRDVSNLVIYLGSENNNAITGQSIAVDGGYTISG